MNWLCNDLSDFSGDKWSLHIHTFPMDLAPIKAYRKTNSFLLYHSRDVTSSAVNTCKLVI